MFSESVENDMKYKVVIVEDLQTNSSNFSRLYNRSVYNPRKFLKQPKNFMKEKKKIAVLTNI